MSDLCITPQPREILRVSSHKTDPWLFRFKPIGAPIPMNPLSMNAIQTIGNFSIPELGLLKIVERNLSDINEVKINRTKLTKLEIRQLATAIPIWRTKHLWVKIKRGHYLINPYFIVPPLEHQKAVLKYWDKLKPKDQFNQYI